MLPPVTLAKNDSNTADHTSADGTPSPVSAAVGKAGSLLLDLSDQALRLGVFVSDNPSAKALAGSLCRRAELARQIGRKMAVAFDPDTCDAVALATDAILALDGIAIDVEYATDLDSEVKIKNQIARARLAITVASSSIEAARRVIAAHA